jgi:hypothetical protein
MAESVCRSLLVFLGLLGLNFFLRFYPRSRIDILQKLDRNRVIGISAHTQSSKNSRTISDRVHKAES